MGRNRTLTPPFFKYNVLTNTGGFTTIILLGSVYKTGQIGSIYTLNPMLLSSLNLFRANWIRRTVLGKLNKDKEL